MEYRRLRDIAISTQYGYTSEETSLVEGKYKYLRITDIVPYFVDFDRVPYCTIPDSKVNQYLVEEGDILVARTGATTGYNYVVGKDVKNTVFASYLIRFKIDEKQVEPTYLKYIMKSQMYYGFVKNYIGGSAQPGMNAKVFGRFNFPLPSLPIQRRIASILSSYDNLIELNTRRIKLLEQMAENLYEEWFVRFRFPNYQNTPIENGIPKGWKVETLGDFGITLTSGSRPKGGIDTSLQEGIPSLGAEAIKGLAEFDYSSVKLIPEVFYNQMKRGKNTGNDILLYKDGAYIGRTTVFRDGFPFNNYAINEHVFIISPVDIEYKNYLYFTLHQDAYFCLMQNLNRNAAQPGLSNNDINKIKVLFPNKELISEYNQIVEPILKNIFQLAHLSANLTRQRDLLLPRLMSGQLPTQ